MTWEPIIPPFRSLPLIDRVRALLDYDADTGFFRWRISVRPNVPAGSIAGHVEKNGYRRIFMDGRRYLAHRLAWMVVHGEMPELPIDHINRNKDDNRISNLRLATISQNSGNVGALHRHNTSGYRGVTFRKARGSWLASIRINDRLVRLGHFKTPEEASLAYQKAARAHFGEFFNDPAGR